jgi:ATP-dependent protease Clp ATPase subunit
MTTAGRVASCSFCLKPNTEVRTLVAGPGVFICDGCVALSGALIAAKPAGVPRVSPWETEFDLERVMANLPRIAAAKQQVEENLAGWVRRSRELGATWTAVGDALGMTRQSAWERFAGEQ